MERLQAILKAHAADGEDTTNKLLGVSFAVVNKEGTLFAGSAGRSRMDPSSRPFGPDTFTWIASATKLITATCVMQLVEQGKIGLDDDVRPLAPELAKMQIIRGFDGEKPVLEDNNRPITIRILLTHTLGLPYDLADEDLIRWSKYTNRTDTAMTWSRNGFFTPIKFAPGDGWLYGPATDWAGLVLEAITGDTLGAYMQRNIFDKLSMTDTTFKPERLPHTKGREVEWVTRDDAGKLAGAAAWTNTDTEIDSGGAGLFSTAADYSKFQRAFIAGELVSQETIKVMLTPQLNEKQRADMEKIAYESGEQTYQSFVPEFPKGTPINHGLAGIINTYDVEGKRRKGSIFLWVDSETGIAAVMVVNVLPHGDAVAAKLWNELERGVYESLKGSSG